MALFGHRNSIYFTGACLICCIIHELKEMLTVRRPNRDRPFSKISSLIGQNPPAVKPSSAVCTYVSLFMYKTNRIAFEEIRPRYNIPVCYVMLKAYGKAVLDLVSLKCTELDEVSISGHMKITSEF
jgi:hypothetical protein